MARRVFSGSDLVNTDAAQDSAVQQNAAPVQNEPPVQPVIQQTQAPAPETTEQSPTVSCRRTRRTEMEGAGAAPAPFRAAAAISQKSFQPAAAAERSIQPQQPVQREAVVSRAVQPVQPVQKQEEENPYAHMFASWDLLPPMMVIRRVKRK